MDKISDILNSVKERLSNPFFLAFIISWIAFNPKITVALLWYDPKQIELAGYASIFQFIDSNTNTWFSFFIPLASALAYTAVLRNLVMWLTTWANTYGDRRDAKISKGSTIPMSKYLTLKNDYDKRTQALEQIIQDESKQVQDYNEVVTKKMELEIEKHRDSLTIQEFRKKLANAFNTEFIAGTWKVQYELASEPIFVEIHQNNFTIFDGTNRFWIFTIHSFAYDEARGRVFFTKYKTNTELVLSPMTERILREAGQLDRSTIAVSLDVKDIDHLYGDESPHRVSYIRNTPISRDLLM